MYFVVNDSLGLHIGSFDDLNIACGTADDFDSTGSDKMIVGPADDLLAINDLSDSTISSILKENDIDPLLDRFENLEVLSILFQTK